FLAGSVGDRHAEIVGHCFRCAGSGSGHPGKRGLDENAGSIPHVAVRNLVGFRVNQLNVANGVGGVLHGSGDTFIPLASQAHGPFDRGGLAKVNARQGLRCKVRRCGDSGKVVGGNDGTEHGREMKDGAAVFVLESFELIVIHGAIGGAEIDGTLGDLLNAAARTDRLIVDFDRGVFLVVYVEPFRIHGVRESGPRTSYGQRASCQDASDAESYQNDSYDALHMHLRINLAFKPSLASACYGIVTIAREFFESLEPGLARGLAAGGFHANRLASYKKQRDLSARSAQRTAFRLAFSTGVSCLG